MSSIQIQIPVTRFSVAYEVGASRPYSVFERLLLQAIDDGESDLETLALLFAVPNRLVVEGVVTLIQAGWVGLSSDDNSLLTTGAGQAAIKSGEQPTTLETTRPFPLHVVMDRVTGSYCRNADVTLVRDQELDPPTGGRIVRLQARIHDNHLDTGDVRPLLRVEPGQWVRWISPDGTLVSKGSQSAIGVYDPKTGRLTNLPERLRSAIEPLLVAEFGGPATSYVPRLELPKDSRQCLVSLTAEDLIVNGDEHDVVLRSALNEAAAHFVACSAFANATVLRSIMSEIRSAVERGVSVDLLWGYRGEQSQLAETQELVRKIQYDTRSAAGSLTFNESPSGSHAKVLIWDGQNSQVNACVGSFNWLSGHGNALGELSVKIRHPHLIADLARFVADRWSEIPGARLEAPQRRWHQLSSAWEQLAAEAEAPDDGSVASLVFGRAHEAALRRAVVDSSPGVLVILSHRIAAAGLRRLGDGRAISRAEFTGVVAAGELLDDVSADDVTSAAEALGVRYLNRPVHAKVLIHGDSTIIGSYNYLSADPPSRGGRSRELSIRFDGLASRRLVQARLPDIWRAPRPA